MMVDFYKAGCLPEVIEEIAAITIAKLELQGHKVQWVANHKVTEPQMYIDWWLSVDNSHCFTSIGGVGINDTMIIGSIDLNA